MCGAPVGTALYQQLWEHPESRAVEEARAISELCLVLSGCVIRGMKSLPKKDIVPLSSAPSKLCWRLYLVAKTNRAHRIFCVLPYNSQPVLQVDWEHVVEFWHGALHLLPLFLLFFFQSPGPWAPV